MFQWWSNKEKESEIELCQIINFHDILQKELDII